MTAPVQQVRNEVPKAFAELGFPSAPSAGEGDSVFLTPALKIRGRLYPGERNSLYLDCGSAAGGGRAADLYEVTFAMLVRLLPQDSTRTMVNVLVDGAARDRTLALSNSLTCVGTGRLENEFLQRLEAHLESH